MLGNLGANVGDSEYQFIRWFDLIGVQRHIKVLGIFCRLWHRDGKIGYLGDLPLTFEYVLDACRRYPELVEFGRWLEWRIAPLLADANARETQRAQRRAAAPAKPGASAAKPKRKAAKQSQAQDQTAKPQARKPKAGEAQGRARAPARRTGQAQDEAREARERVKREAPRARRRRALETPVARRAQ